MWYPAAEAEENSQLLHLSSEDRAGLAKSLPGTPLVWNHTATAAHVATGLDFNQLGEISPSSGQIGQVKDAWVAPDGSGHAVVSVTGANMGGVVGTPVAGAVSLTHARDSNGKAHAIELSLVNKPARPGAIVTTILDSPSSAATYKSSMFDRGKVSMEVDTPAVVESTLSPIETGVQSIADEAQRTAVTTRMEEMATCAIEAKKDLKTLQDELERYKRQSDTDAAATKEAIAMWVDSLGPDIAARWRVNSLADHTGNQWPNTFVRSMVSASHDKIVSMQRGGDADGVPAKRPRHNARDTSSGKFVSGESAAPAAAAPVKVQSNPLRAALANTFETGFEA